VPVSLSVVIPSHNRPDLLAACLRSVVRHAPARTEVLVVDDGSPNGEASAISRQFPAVQVVRLPRRRGFCVAANAGIRAACGEIIELLNDDTEVTASWAEEALAAFIAPTVAAVAPLVLCWQGPDVMHLPPLIDSAGDRYYIGGVAGKRGHRQPLRPEYLASRSVFGASASSAFFRRKPLLDVGAFPESFGAYFEDVDLAFRLRRAGYEIRFAPGSRVYHHVSASYGCPVRRLLEQQSRNEERVYWRNLPAAALMHALPQHVAVLAGKAWRRWHEGQLLPFFWGRLRLLGEIPALVRHRRWLRQLGPAVKPASWGMEPRYWG
jgi:GT2 family glycosyltransferase